MSKKFKIVKKYFDEGLWDEYKVRKAVEKEWITKQEFAEIVGHEF